MARRYFNREKEKWIADPSRPPKRAPVILPESDCSRLTDEHRFTLIGRVTNPAMQNTRALVNFFLQHWQVIGTFTGRALGPLLFQFTFTSEQDLQSVLSKGPYHFKRWICNLQRWESIVSDSFPANLQFWVTIHGIPLHYWTDAALRAIGKALGPVETIDELKGMIRVTINGLKPLEKYLEISLKSGETKQVELEYEKLEKHCFSCRSLSHEAGSCPNKATMTDSSSSRLSLRNNILWIALLRAGKELIIANSLVSHHMEVMVKHSIIGAMTTTLVKICNREITIITDMQVAEMIRRWITMIAPTPPQRTGVGTYPVTKLQAFYLLLEKVPRSPSGQEKCVLQTPPLRPTGDLYRVREMGVEGNPTLFSLQSLTLHLQKYKGNRWGWEDDCNSILHILQVRIVDLLENVDLL
ncbi:hypothetical protein Bca4012_057959 [Brassica carinata]